MPLSSTLLNLALLATAHASALPAHTLQARDQEIKWGPCPDGLNSTAPAVCGTLTVPLDYTDKSSKETLDLDIIKVAAIKQPVKGSIITNWGGPGGDGLYNLAGIAARMLDVTGGYHDLLSFNPRGTGKTLTYSCFNATERALAGSVVHAPSANSSDTAIGRIWAEGKVIADACLTKLNKTGDLVGTAFVARDIMQIVDALGGDKMLRYWGVSYGTTLGATVAAMFPDRIESMILDAVQNPHEYYHTYGDPEEFSEADSTWHGFFTGCIATPSNCALAYRAKTADELQAIFYDLLDYLKYNPISVGGAIIDYTMASNLVHTKVYYPTQWPDLALTLETIFQRNLTVLAAFAGAAAPAPSDGGIVGESSQGIRCSDKFLRTSKLTDIMPELDLVKSITKYFWQVPVFASMAQCAQWRFAAKERYDGDFHAKTRKPMLIIGSPYDPVTPLVSAKNVSAGFEGSVVLQHNGYGHLSLVHKSNCTIRYIQDYYVNATLPAPGTICEPNHPLFDPNIDS